MDTATPAPEKPSKARKLAAACFAAVFAISALPAAIYRAPALDNRVDTMSLYRLLRLDESSWCAAVLIAAGVCVAALLARGTGAAWRWVTLAAGAIGLLALWRVGGPMIGGEMVVYGVMHVTAGIGMYLNIVLFVLGIVFTVRAR